MVSALLVAEYIIGTSKTLLTPMHIIKLAYISHGFTLAIDDKPLFVDKVEAWKYGPVIPSIYYPLRHYKGGQVTALPYCETELSTPEKEDRLISLSRFIKKKHQQIIDVVMEKYGHFSGLELSTITHEPGTPWHKCYKQGILGIEIPNPLTREYYLTQLQK